MPTVMRLPSVVRALDQRRLGTGTLDLIQPDLVGSLAERRGSDGHAL